MTTTTKPPSLLDQAQDALVVTPRAHLMRHLVDGIDEALLLGPPCDHQAWMWEWANRVGPTGAMMLARFDYLIGVGAIDVDLRKLCARVGVSDRWGTRNAAGFNALLRLASFRLIRIERAGAANVVYVHSPVVRPPARKGDESSAITERWTA